MTLEQCYNFIFKVTATYPRKQRVIWAGEHYIGTTTPEFPDYRRVPAASALLWLKRHSVPNNTQKYGMFDLLTCQECVLEIFPSILFTPLGYVGWFLQLLFHMD